MKRVHMERLSSRCSELMSAQHPLRSEAVHSSVMSDNRNESTADDALDSAEITWMPVQILQPPGADS